MSRRACLQTGKFLSLRGAEGDEAIPFSGKDYFAEFILSVVQHSRRARNDGPTSFVLIRSQEMREVKTSKLRAEYVESVTPILPVRKNTMNLEERKRLEDKIDAMLASLTRGEKAIFYKTLYAEGFKISDCDDIIRKEPPPIAVTVQASSQLIPSRQTWLSRGWPPMRTS